MRLRTTDAVHVLLTARAETVLVATKSITYKKILLPRSYSLHVSYT